MSKIGLIMKREYMTIVAKKSFIFTTLLVPILSIVICGILPAWMSNMTSDDKKNVLVIDQTEGQQFLPYIHDAGEYAFQPVAEPTSAEPDSLQSLFHNQGNAYAMVVIPAHFVESQLFNVFSENTVPGSLEGEIRHMLREPLQEIKIAAHGGDSLRQVLADCQVNIQSYAIKWNEQGEASVSSGEAGTIVGIALAFLTYMFVLLYGAMIMNGVVEEKTNRIVEVIVSCCKPFELMMGKILGVALVGLTQVAIWVVLLTVIGSAFGFGDLMGGAAMQEVAGQVQPAGGFFGMIAAVLSSLNIVQVIACFILFFIGGYLLYASLFAAFGSAVDQASDASQFTGPIIMIMVFALYAAMFSIENPDGPLAWWCSMIPFTSPIVMMIRLPYDVPTWELILSLGILFGTATGIVWLAGRIYRTGILMYGRKFSFKDIIKWIR